MAISLKRPALSALRPNIGLGALVFYGLAYLVITTFVVAVLFRDYVLPIEFTPLGIKIPPFVYLVAIAFAGYLFQRKLSSAYGGRRVIDLMLSVPMLVVVALAFAAWIGFPFVQAMLSKAGDWAKFPIEFMPNEYKVAAGFIFGFFALLDVVGRDILGIGRGSSGYGGRTSGAPLGEFDQAPHEPLDLASESGNPFMRTKGPLLIDVDECWVRLPNGRMFQIPFTERMIRRTEWNLADRGLPRPAGTSGGTDAGGS